MPRADRMYYTEVHASPEGDTRFPPFERGEWQEIAREGPLQGAKDQYPYSFVTLERKSAR
jgi:dihydrofolate reductase